MGKEVKTFRKLKRQLIPISFGDSLEALREDSPFHKYFPAHVLREHETAEGLQTGPTTALVEKIDRDFKGIRQDRWRLRLATVAALGFAAIAAVAVTASFVANYQRKIAIENEAKTSATLAQREMDAGDVAAGLERAIEAMLSVGREQPKPAAAERAIYRGLRDIRETAVWRPVGDRRIVAATAWGTSALLSSRRGVSLVDLRRAQVVAEIEVGDAPVVAFAVSPDGSHFAMLNTVGDVTVRQVSSSAAEPSFARLGDDATAIAFSPTGELVVGHVDGRVRLWKLTAILFT